MNRRRSQRSILILLSLALSVSACSSKKKNSGSPSNLNGRISPTYDGPQELPLCSTVTPYSDAITVTGLAYYQARQPFSGGLGEPGSPQAIRQAEVRVTNESGTVVQCATTTDSGSFSLQLPKGSSTFTLSVNSRGSNSRIQATVFDAPERNAFYSLSKSLTPNQDQDVGTLLAAATGDVVGGAFNIYDQILNANDYLRAKVGNCSAVVSGCPDFTTAPKVKVYWEKGFNPGSYFGSSSISFYLPGYSRLFILGGQNGDVDHEDTDHFDNSVILHEYGHFLEDVYTKTDSPGGPHSGNRLIDPRLAWGEGWGNFIQAAILGVPIYRDTVGNVDGSTGLIFGIDLEQPDALCSISPSTPGCDVPQFDGEGNFREFSVTRILWDVIDEDATDQDSDGVENGFPEIWATLTRSSGFLNSGAAFRSVGLLHFIQDRLNGGSPITDWDSLRGLTQHLHIHDPNPFRKEYANKVVASGACDLGSSPFSLTPYKDLNDNGSFETSHLLRNNDFYHINHSGGPLTITMNYQTQSGVEADLDLYLYNVNGRYGSGRIESGGDIVALSQNEPDGNLASTQSESLSVSNLAAGEYLINAMVYTGRPFVGGPTNYEVLLNGVSLCSSDPF